MLPVTDWFIIKSLTIPSSWIAILLALFITGIVLRMKFGKDTEDWFSDAAILFLIVWKFSVVFTDFDMIVKYPLGILYFNGGETGFYIALVLALSRLVWQIRSRGLPEREVGAMLIGFVLLQSLYQFLMVIMNEAEIWQKLMTIVIFTGMTTLTWKKAFASNVWRLQLLTLFLFTHILAAVLQPEGVFQSPLMVTVLFVICGFTVSIFLNKQQMEENK